MKNKIYLVIDESGAKGYEDKEESCLGEVGVMAGFLVSDADIKKIRSSADSVLEGIEHEGKMHITDLNPDKQEEMRTKYFALITQKNIPCLYEAIHVDGFNDIYKEKVDAINQAKELTRSATKVSNNIETESLHTELFSGVFGKAIAYCVDTYGEDLELAVITDQVDAPIKKRFEQRANNLLKAGETKSVEVKGYDLDKHVQVNGSITVKVKDDCGLMGDLSSVEFSIACEDSPLVTMADVIANSLNHHFKERKDVAIGSSLNTKKAISEHVLANHMVCVSDENFSDAIYQHPSSP